LDRWLRRPEARMHHLYIGTEAPRGAGAEPSVRRGFVQGALQFDSDREHPMES
jgi:hypothetical protein